MSDYTFFHLGRIGADEVDNTQRNIFNSRHSNYTLTNYFADSTADSHVSFATQYPTMMYNGLSGVGLNGSLVDADSSLLLGATKGRSLERLSLKQRPFLTVPYLGKGSCDVLLESQMTQGENSRDRKSASTIMSKSFSEHSLYPVDGKMAETSSDPKHTIEEFGLDGWVRGGMTTRGLSTDDVFAKQSRPNSVF